MTELADLRKRLDATDDRILAAVAERYEVIRDIAEYKRVHGVPMSHPDRIAHVRERYRRFAETIGIEADRLELVAVQLIEAACALETKLMAAGEPGESGAEA